MSVQQEDLWFNTPDSNTLCRAGGNGPLHPSQLSPLEKYYKPEHMSILDYGSGSATTYEAIKTRWPEVWASGGITYRGLDIIEKNTKWCQENFPQGDFKWNPTIHRIDEVDKSWDIVFSRHVVDHMESFEKAMDEHCRVAKQFVVVVFWVPLSTGDEHEIKNIVDQRGLPTEKTFVNEYTNQYSRKKVEEWIHNKIHEGWKLREFTEGIGTQVKGHDWSIVLERV